MLLLETLNIFFFIFHGIIIFINLFGWCLWRFRYIHYLVLSSTLFSWFVLGLIYGWGYCFLTDWHYEILQKLGYSNLPSSYIKFCLDQLLGTDLNPQWVDIGTTSGLFLGIVGAIFNLIKNKKITDAIR